MPARRAGDPSGQSEDPPPEGLGGHGPFGQTDARCPAGEITCTASQAPLAAKPRGEMVESDAVFQVSNGVLDLGVAAMIGLQFHTGR